MIRNIFFILIALSFSKITLADTRKDTIDIKNQIKANLIQVSNTPKKIDTAQSTPPPPRVGVNIVLVCEEAKQRDIQLENRQRSAVLGNSQWSEADKRERELLQSRNNHISRPYFSIKYLGGKISFNNSGNLLLTNETPGVPNNNELMGLISFQEESLIFEFERIGQIKTRITIDRYTGLYQEQRFHGDELLTIADGRCKKLSEKLF